MIRAFLHQYQRRDKSETNLQARKMAIIFTLLIRKRGCVSLISSYNGNARFMTVLLNLLSGQVWIRYADFFVLTVYFLLWFLCKKHAHFLRVRNNGEIHRNDHFMLIFLFFDKIKDSRVPLWIGCCYLCLEGQFNYAYSSFKY